MVYQGNDLNPLYDKPIFWAVLGLMTLIGTVYDFKRTFEHGPQHRKYYVLVYDSCYLPTDNRTDLEKFWSALSRNRDSDKAVLVLRSKNGAKIPLRSGWKAHVKTLQNPALKGAKLKLFYSINDKSYWNPRRIEVNGELIDDFEDDYISPFAYLALTLWFFGIAARLQWRIWQESFAIRPKRE